VGYEKENGVKLLFNRTVLRYNYFVVQQFYSERWSSASCLPEEKEGKQP
jgi:hypothetical protein